MEKERLYKHLQAAGLSKKEAIVYNTTLELGGAFPSKIAKASGLNRSTVYEILTHLSIKGLVGEIEKKNKLYYQIEKPQKLLRYAKQKIKKAQDAHETLEKLLPTIEGLYQNVPHKPKIMYYDGIEGVRSVFEDHVLVDKSYEMLAYANATELKQFMPQKFFDSYIKRKEKIGITTRGIVPDTKTDRDFNKVMYDQKGIQKKFWLDLRFIPKEDFPYKGEIVMYGKDRVSILNMEKEHPIGVIIENQMIHDMMVMIFELAWKGAKK